MDHLQKTCMSRPASSHTEGLCRAQTHMRSVQSRERSALRLRARRPMRLLPVRAPPAEDEGTRRDCPVCLEETSVNADWVSLTAGHDWMLHDTNDCLSCQAAVVMLCVSVIWTVPSCPPARPHVVLSMLRLCAGGVPLWSWDLSGVLSAPGGEAAGGRDGLPHVQSAPG